MPLSGMADTGGAEWAQTGDEVTLLVTRYRDSNCEQWLARVRLDSLTLAEWFGKPRPDAVVYSGTGRTLRFGYAPAALRVAFAGPFEAAATTGHPSSAQDVKDERLVTNAQFLSYGLDEFCRVKLKEARLRTEGALKGPGVYYSSYPPPPEALANSKRVAKLLQLTEAEDRITGGCWYPISSFVETVTAVPDFKFVLLPVVDFPSIWSVIKNLGIYSSWNFGGYQVEVHPFADTGLPLYHFSLLLYVNGHPAINAVVAVVAPRPPLEVCAGIVGIYAESPAHPAQRLFIQAIASRRPGLREIDGAKFGSLP